MKRFFAIFLFSISFIGSVISQVDRSILAMAELVKSYNHFGKYNPQEKVYLHFDNTGYYLGETLWFSAYVVTSPQLRPTEMSKVLYVELLTPEGRIVETKKLKIEGGRSHGEFVLTPTQLTSGFYEVRAYTRVMLNWEGTYFSRVFPVFDKPEEEGVYERKITKVPPSRRYPEYRPRMEKLKSLNLTFYPEGGDLVSGLPGLVAFKAVDGSGRSLSVSGDIYDSEGRSIGQITTRHRGMGRFEFTPGPKPHEVRITYDGKTHRYPLPAAKTEGYTLRAETTDPDSLHIQIRRSRGAEGQWVGLVVSCRGIAHSFEVSDLREEESAEFHLSRSTFPEGVHQITLFTSEGEILGERQMFHYRGNSRLQIETAGEKPMYRPYEKVQLQVSVKDRESRPVPSRLSVSVRDVGREVPTNYRSDMTANLLLESDVRGYIEDVDYYIESTDADHRLAADLLMLVQGWRRYAWQEQTGIEPFEAKHKVEEGILVKGQVLDYKITGSQLKAGSEVSVWIYSDFGTSHNTTKTDSLGQFSFLSKDEITGTAEMVLRTRGADSKGRMKDRSYLVELDREFSPPGRLYRSEDTCFVDSAAIIYESIVENPVVEGDTVSYLLPDTVEAHQLEEVEIKARRKHYGFPQIVYDVARESDRLFDSGEHRDMPDDIHEFLMRINPLFRESARGFAYKSKGVVILEDPYKQPYNSIDDIDSIEILENYLPPDALRSWDGEPLDLYRNVYVVLHLKPWNEQRREKKGYRRTTIQGYSVAKHFFEVDYSKGHLPDERDYRRTLYWNPDLATDSLGRAQITFYNNSTATRLRVDAATLSPDGVIGVFMD